MSAVMNLDGFDLLLSRLGLDLLFVGTLVLLVYYRRHRSPDYVFSSLVINLVTFLLCFLTQRSTLELGFALGLFAVFGILRYRTESIPIRDLTYLFAAIGIAIFNGMPDESTSVMLLVVVNGVLVLATALLEASRWAGRRQRTVVYDKLALLRGGHEAELHADLSQRLGVSVIGARVDRLDLLKEIAEITVYYGV